MDMRKILMKLNGCFFLTEEDKLLKSIIKFAE